MAAPDMTICYDERGRKYEIPRYVVSDPSNLAREGSGKRTSSSSAGGGGSGGGQLELPAVAAGAGSPDSSSPVSGSLPESVPLNQVAVR